jgi:hypothetical protein
MLIKADKTPLAIFCALRHGIVDTYWITVTHHLTKKADSVGVLKFPYSIKGIGSCGNAIYSS